MSDYILGFKDGNKLGLDSAMATFGQFAQIGFLPHNKAAMIQIAHRYRAMGLGIYAKPEKNLLTAILSLAQQTIFWDEEFQQILRPKAPPPPYADFCDYGDPEWSLVLGHLAENGLLLETDETWVAEPSYKFFDYGAGAKSHVAQTNECDPC